MEPIKEKIRRFKRWQEQPFEFKITSDEVHQCNNCGYEFTGNFCPVCSQKAGEGAIGWRSVRQSFMDIWGLGSRSMPRTLWHLLTRPGYLISDYISGKRQVSFPPVKMLFFVAVIVVLFIYYLFPLLFGSAVDPYGGQVDAYVGFNEWIKAHFAWTYFIIAVLYILPTWILFRYSPRHTRHTLPQGFFIQVFLCSLNLFLTCIMSTLLLIDYTVYITVSGVALLAYYTITYKQLFGYGLWGTIWRVAIIFWCVMLIMTSLMNLVFEVDFSQLDPKEFSSENSRFYYAGKNMAEGLMILGAGWIINLIATKVSQLKLKKTKHREERR